MSPTQRSHGEHTGPAGRSGIDRPRPDVRSASHGTEPASRTVAQWLYWASIVLVAYAEIYPFDFERPPSLPAAWDAFITNPSLWTSAGDVVGNVLLCVPMGLFAWALYARGGWRRPSAVLVFAFNVFWAFALQAVQIWFPPRDASLSDVFWNTVGILVGMLLAVPLARLLSRRPERQGADVAVPLALLAGWLATQLAPFIPSLDWQLVKDSLKPLLLAPEIKPVSLVFTTARVLAAGLLVEAVVGDARRAARAFALLLAGVLAAKVLIVNQGLTPNNVGGFVAGYAVWWALRGVKSASARLGTALGVLFVAYTLEALLPFEVRAQPVAMHLLPFDALLQGAIEVNAWALVEAAYVFGALLWLAGRSGGSVMGVATVLAAWVGLMEWLQRWLVGRTSDITMPMLVLALGFLMQNLAVRRPAAAQLAAPGRSS